MAATGEVRVPETFGGRVIGSPEGAGARRVIFHSDMNAFYASVEQAERPELRGVPLVVGGHEELRHGIVLAKSAQAKAAGVKTGEALWEARAKCPGLVVVPPRYEVYQAYSAMARRIYYQYTDLVEPFGLDEAWLDLTGSLPLLGGDPARTAAEISGRIKAELGCTVSVGVSWNKIFAKFGSDFRKPDAITFITPQNYRCRVWEAPVSELLYVGAATRAKLHSSGIDRIGELACASPELLRRRLGKIGLVLRAFARGEDATPVKPYDQARNEVDRTVKSFGNGLTAPHDIVSASDAKALVYLLSESVAQRLREARFRASTVSIGVRSARDLASYSRQTTLRRATNVTGVVARTAWGCSRPTSRWTANTLCAGCTCAPRTSSRAMRRSSWSWPSTRAGACWRTWTRRSTTCAAASATPASSAARSCWTRACWGWISRRRTSCIPWATSTTEGGRGAGRPPARRPCPARHPGQAKRSAASAQDDDLRPLRRATGRSGSKRGALAVFQGLVDIERATRFRPSGVSRAAGRPCDGFRS